MKENVGRRNFRHGVTRTVGRTASSEIRWVLGVTGKRNAKRSSIPYLDSVCGLMWVGLPGSECPDWLVERGKEAWLQNLRFSCIRFRR
ncbi:hypothetical protein TNCV_2893611 [Trichonephila clavipes]|nr:hypothetical protein TNCV_2893611 [Trichonephila clavipes]